MMSENLPLVSIVVPSFNQGRFIRDTLDSILGQDYPRIEVLVMDGGSTDETVSILKGYGERISFVSEPDNGQSHAINKGFQSTKGEIVAWLNSDDIYPDRSMIGQMVRTFSIQPAADLIYGDFIEIDSRNRILKYHRRPGFSHHRLLRVGYISQPATFFRRRVIERMAVCESLHFCMDLEYWLRANRLGFQICHVPMLVAAERLHSAAKCLKDRDRMEAEALAVRKQFGAKNTHLYRMARKIDRLFLYLVRLPAILDLIEYQRAPKRITVPLDFNGAILRTMLIGLRNSLPTEPTP